MLGQTYMNANVNKVVTTTGKRHTVNVSDEKLASLKIQKPKSGGRYQ